MATAQPSHPACGEANDLATSSRGGGGKGGITTRRREANRLAAQRFRNRKKGYQNSLEERIRILEHEKDLVAKSLNRSHQRLEPDDVCYRQMEALYPNLLDRIGDGDVRYASLESVNRSLKSDWRGAMVANARLKDEVERWRTCEGAQKHFRPASVLPTISTYHEPALDPSYPSLMAPPSFTSAFYSSMYPPWLSPPPPERGYPSTKRYCYPPSPCQHLPPIATQIPSAERLRTPPFPVKPKSFRLRPQSREHIKKNHSGAKS
jgi:hypothetical protein